MTTNLPKAAVWVESQKCANPLLRLSGNQAARLSSFFARASKSETAKIIETVLAEEGRKPESVFDFVQGITAVARHKTHQDARLDLEARAKKLLDRAA